MSYAKVLGATSRQDGYLEGNDYLVSWCVGHLVELAPPNVYDAKYVKWSIADLPILPQKWQYLVSASTKKQFGILKDLMNRPDVDSIVNSCDSGREGELIFRLVYQQAGCKKPFSRLWLSSMEENAIREGFAHLKPSTEYDALYNAALCRERADWMVGINASRLFSCLYGQPLAVGRVMTPVLAMTVVREAAIAAFVPEKFYTVALTLADGGTASSKRFAQKADAELLLSKCRKEGRVTVQKMERKEKSESPPQLYDLTALQRDANRLLGFTAQQTLDYAQSLYEKRLITYPRTDSRFLTEDMAASLPGLVTATGKAFAVEEPISIHVQQVINGSKVTDHHALLPTKSMANADLAALPAGERNILRLIAARLLCAVGELHRYAETTLTTLCAGEEFSAKGKVVLSEGWKAIERKMLGELLGKQKEPAVLPDVQERSQCSVSGAELKEGQTSPPKSYTEDTLLSAMQAAGGVHIAKGGQLLIQNWKFQRGDIFFTRFDNAIGSEQSGNRPAVVLQNDVGNFYSPTLIVATLTSKAAKKYTQPTHCLLVNEFLSVPSIVQAEQIFTVDKSRVLKYLGHLTPEEMSRVDDAVRASLALNPMGSIQRLPPIIRSTAAYAPPEVVDGKPPLYPYTPIKSSFEDAGSVEDMMLYTELEAAVHAMIQRLEYSFTFNPSLLTIPKRKQQVAEILKEAETYIWRIKEEMRCA